MKPYALLFSVVTLLFGCNDETLDGGSNAALSAPRACDNRALESTCADYPEGVTPTYVRTTCDGEPVATVCPRERAVGTCSVTTSVGTATNVYYSDGVEPWNPERAAASCATFPGTFQTL